MKRTPLKAVSEKQTIELAKRRLLKFQLFNEQKGRCKCGKIMTYYHEASDNYPHLSHTIPLSRGGKTEKGNISVLCAECHGEKHGLRNKYNSQSD